MIFVTAMKEFTLLLRDMHALAVLFLMPLAFVIIMSLAMPDTHGEPPTFTGAILNPADSIYNRTLSQYLHQAQGAVVWQSAGKETLAGLKQRVNDKQLDVIVALPEQADDQPLDITDTVLYLAPHINARDKAMIEAMVRGQLGKVRLFMFLKNAQGAQTTEALARIRKQADATTAKDHLRHEYLFRQASRATPSAVQQSVPAWLVFGMFFVLIPLSSTMIVELQQGTLRRLQSMNIAAGPFLAGKVLPYFVINQVQMLLMLAAGTWLIPVLGGDKLVINGSPLALMAMSAVCSVAALGFAMLLSVAARSTEQATALGGAANIILAAIGGIMIPKFVMPEAMQKLADISPMSWALDGFLEVILYGGGLGAITTEMAALCGFAAVSFALAVIQFKRRSGYYG